MSTHKNKRRLVAIGALTAASALIIPAAFAADSYPPQGDSAVASAQPVVSGYRVQDLRDWTPNLTRLQVSFVQPSHSSLELIEILTPR